MNNKNDMYYCELCGNIVEMVHDSGVRVSCCGMEMKPYKLHDTKSDPGAPKNCNP